MHSAKKEQVTLHTFLVGTLHSTEKRLTIARNIPMSPCLFITTTTTTSHHSLRAVDVTVGIIAIVVAIAVADSIRVRLSSSG